MSSSMSHTMEQTGTTIKRKRRVRKIISPEVGSLYDILHDYAGKTLYISPLGWTDLHTQLLGCRFVPQPSQTTPTPTPVSSQSRASQPQTSDIVVSIGRTLDNLMDSFNSKQQTEKSIHNLLTLLYPGQLSSVNPDISIRCGRSRLLGSVRCQALWKKSEGPSSSFESITTCSSSIREPPMTRTPTGPVLAFLDLKALNFARRSCFRVRPLRDGSINVPIHRLHEIRTAQLVPKNPDEDQYILAAMIAMAQRHVYLSHYTGAGFKPKDVELRILSVSDQDQSLVVYKSVIPGAFLGMFDDFSKAPQGDAKVTIQYQRVPIWPILGLKERLGQALGQDIVGEINLDHIETYQNGPLSNSQNGLFDSQDNRDDLEKSIERDLIASFRKYSPKNETLSHPRLPESSKRKRHILSEVMNVSFSEDRESSDFSDNLLVKRRHLEEGRVGVVR
ncbi:hypothetical protein F4805DRAFT_350883 [Annulohypoxylon moriforme]|nr:hypothetical protein F4805DRAFT_350883 [Annulohypoxylon moriforme]